MRKGLPKDDLGFGLAAVTFATFVAGLLFFGAGRTGAHVGEEKYAHAGRQDQDKHPKVNITFHTV